ncbi:MAG: 16S rRNA (cytidine(1402)-2'-O)-methyltransferase [Clostridia bacterium]|nr:16S rRNA (cytidine(1402)-2'-O)-methyltransferase [Clostridia bacterium]
MNKEDSFDEKNKIVGGVLYVVATPIGNLDDITLRALKTLSEVDYIAAEDTRNSRKLLSHYDINTPMISYHEHNKYDRGDQIIKRLREGKSYALITDAGMPGISDPGQELVRMCLDEEIPVTVVPGASAGISALVISGLPTDKFVFEGFLDGNHNAHIKRLEQLKDEKRTLIFYEAPHRLRTTLSEMESVFGDREISVCRELTKKNEEVIRSTLMDINAYYEEVEPRGEYVLIIRGAEYTSDELFWQDMTLREHFDFYCSQGMDNMEAIKKVARDRGVGKNVIYSELMRKE